MRHGLFPPGWLLEGLIRRTLEYSGLPVTNQLRPYVRIKFLPHSTAAMLTFFGESNSLIAGPFSSSTANRRIDLLVSFNF
jgi:hypothetical protein